MDWNDFFRFPIDWIPFVILVLMIAFTVHEHAHAFWADKFGDPTPRSMGRLTLNPRHHLDIFGTLLFIFAGFGWAKPVLINPSNFKKPRLMNVVVSIAGPLSNLLMSFIGMMLLFAYFKFGLSGEVSKGVHDAITLFLQLFIQLNMILFVFNLIPLPPLDGYRILSSFLPNRVLAKIHPYEQWAFFFFLLLVLIPPLYNVTLRPILSLQFPIIRLFSDIGTALFGIRIL